MPDTPDPNRLLHANDCHQWWEVERCCDSNLCRCSCPFSDGWEQHRCGKPDRRSITSKLTALLTYEPPGKGLVKGGTARNELRTELLDALEPVRAYLDAVKPIVDFAAYVQVMVEMKDLPDIPDETNVSRIKTRDGDAMSLTMGHLRALLDARNKLGEL